MNISHSAVVTQWFKNHKGSLHLPDGWYGRPYDNHHEISTVLEREGTLDLVLDDGKLGLLFSGLESVWIDGSDLVFGPFKGLVFRFQHYESEGVQHERTYDSGYVRFFDSEVGRESP